MTSSTATSSSRTARSEVSAERRRRFYESFAAACDRLETAEIKRDRLREAGRPGRLRRQARAAYDLQLEALDQEVSAARVKRDSAESMLWNHMLGHLTLPGR